MDVPDQGTVEHGFRFHPEVITALAFALRVRDERCDQFQDVFLGVDVRKRVVMHALFEVDGVEDLNPVVILLEQFSAFNEDTALGISHNI